MNIHEIYIEKLPIIEEAMQLAFSKLFDNLDSDPDFTLNDDELTEIVLELLTLNLTNQ